MAIVRFLEREHEMAVQEEATYGISPGTVAAGDSFKHQTPSDAVTRVIARYDRDQDRDYAQASVLSAQKGRESSNVKINGDLIPSGNSTTPTEPDMDLLFKAVLGSVHKATAHTTTAAGSTGVTLNLATGGWTASGLADGDLLAVDVDTTFGYEVRQAVSHVADAVTVDRAFSTNPATGRVVKVGTTFKLLNTAQLSLYLKRFIGGTGLKYAVPGLIVPDMEITVDSGAPTPVARVSFSGNGMPEVVHAEARPTFTFLGQALVPSVSQVWFDAGATPKKLCLAGAASLRVNNGLELRENEGHSLVPTGPKRTGNSSRYNVSLSVGMLLMTGDEDTSAIYAALQSFTPQDVLIQLGKIAGSIVAWRCPKWIPDPTLASRDGEIGITVGGGRCYGVAGDDEVVLAFI